MTSPRPAPPPFQLRITDIYVLMLFNFGYLWMWGKPPDTALIVIMLTTIFASWLFMLYFGRQQLKPDNERMYRLCLAVFLLTLPCNLAFSSLHTQAAKRAWIQRKNENIWGRLMLGEILDAQKTFTEQNSTASSTVYAPNLQALNKVLDPQILRAQCDNPISTTLSAVPHNGLFIKGLKAPATAQYFPVVAYPAEYSARTHFTFVLDSSGIIYKKDLGPGTHDFIFIMENFDSASWAVVTEGW